MKTKQNLIQICLLGAMLLALPAAVQAQYGYTDNGNGTCTITSYNGTNTVVTIPNTLNGLTVTSIGNYAMQGNSYMTSLTIPASVTSFGVNSFQNNLNLTSVSIPASITNSGQGGFSGCVNLASVTFANGLTSIGVGEFYYCYGLTSVTIPASVTNIGTGAFNSCTNLTAITVDALNSVYSSSNGVLFNRSQTRLIEFPCGYSGSYTIPSTVQTFGIQACWNSPKLTSVTIPGSVIAVGQDAFYNCTSLTNVTFASGISGIDSGAFDSCSSLRSIYFMGNAPATSPTFSGPPYWPGGFFSDTNATAYYLPGTTGWANFSANTGITAVLWNPQAQTTGASFGVRTNRFGFNITGTSNLVIVVEACTNLLNAVWQPVRSITLNGGAAYFSDPQWTNYPGRFYRLRSP